MELDPGATYAQLLITLRELLQCNGGAVIVPSGSGAIIPAQFGPSPLRSAIVFTPTTNHILASLAQTRQPLLVQRDAPFQPPAPAPAAGRAWIGAPMILGEQLYCFISLVGDFKPGDERLVGEFVDQAAISLRWISRWVAMQRRGQQLFALDQRIRHLQDQATALALLAEAALSLTGATHCGIYMAKQGRAVMLAQRGYTADELSLVQQIPPSLEHGLTGASFLERILTGSEDIANDPSARPALANTRAQIIIPIYVAEKSLGIIDLQSPEPSVFRDIDATVLLALGNLAAVVIEQQRARQIAHQAGDADSITERDLLLSSRLAVVNDLAAGVAHEINNPLTTILGYTHLLLRDQSLPQAARSDIAQIMVEGQRISALVERFLRFAQQSSSGKRPLAIDQPLREALELLKSRFQEAGVDVTLDIPATQVPMVLGQVAELEQAFVELLQNALEAMSTSEERRLNVQIIQHNSWARIAITDTGRGIHSDLLARVFEPGFTTKVDKGISRGLGLGLYAVHTIAQDHWGRIEVQSQVWQGSTFTVCIPAI